MISEKKFTLKIPFIFARFSGVAILKWLIREPKTYLKEK